MVGRRGLQVTTGSSPTNVHRFLDDGSAIISAGGSNKALAISGSTMLGRKTNNVNDVTKVHGVFRIPVYASGSENDIGILNTLAAAPEDYNGHVIYLNSTGLTKGAIANGGSVAVSNDAAQAFSQGHKWYFSRNSAWVPDMFFHLS
jgi:hypothetical protein